MNLVIEIGMIAGDPFRLGQDRRREMGMARALSVPANRLSREFLFVLRLADRTAPVA